MRFRWAIMLIAIIFSLVQLFKPATEDGSFSVDNIYENIKLGLDLQGGIYMQLEVDTEDALQQYLEEQAGLISNNLSAEGLQAASSEPTFETRTVTLKGMVSNSGEDIEDKLEEFYKHSYSVKKISESEFELRLRETAAVRVKNEAVDQTVSKIQNRIDELGVTEPNINRTVGSNRIILELAGADDVERVHNIVKEPGKLEWRMVAPRTSDAASEAELMQSVGGRMPQGFSKVLPNVSTPVTTYNLVGDVMMTAGHVADVFPTRDDRGLPAVGVTLTREGGQIFSGVTQSNVGNRLAIVLDGKIISAPTIQSALSERFIIQGRFSQGEVADMVVKIKSGSLPAEVRILEERVIGPTLGRDARNQGALAAVAGLILVAIFMLFWYSRAGIYAVLSLLMNLIIIMGLLSGISAVLTLPGIAGFILTIGMAVDANVLVFERIREELRKGTAPKPAVEIGYKSAFITIMDANITTMIAAFCLLLMAQGPIKGFAIMLMIGIVSSIFTAVFCSRTFFLAYLNAHKTISKLGIWPMAPVLDRGPVSNS